MDLVKREKIYEGEGQRNMVEWGVEECVECETLYLMDSGYEENLMNLMYKTILLKLEVSVLLKKYYLWS